MSVDFVVLKDNYIMMRHFEMAVNYWFRLNKIDFKSFFLFELESRIVQCSKLERNQQSYIFAFSNDETESTDQSWSSASHEGRSLRHAVAASRTEWTGHTAHAAECVGGRSITPYPRHLS